MHRLAVLVCPLIIAACGSGQNPAPHLTPCSGPWIQFVEQNVPTGDGQGHGPDPGSSEWRSVVEFKLGIRGNPEVPARDTDEWCTFIDEKL